MTARLIFLLVLLANTLVVGTAIVIYSYNGVDHFGEGRFVTIFSGLQLLATAWLSYKVFQVRTVERSHSFWKDPSVVWAVIALGFFFLASDEWFKIHEGIDKLIHYMLGWDETWITDRLDDAIVAIYGLIGIGVLSHYRNELKFYKESRPFFIVGFALLFATVACDTLSNGDNVLRLIFDYDRAQIIFQLLSIAEDVAKVFAEAFFIGAFYSVLQKARHMKKELIINTCG